jgi:hypothetical protein
LVADTGKPLPFARVSLVPCEPLAGLHGLREHVDARADADGRFSVQPLPGTAFKAFACAPEGAAYQMIEHTVRWSAGTIRQELTLSLPPGVALRGQVVDADTGKPVPWAQVIYVAHLATADVPKEELPRLAGGGHEWAGPDGHFMIAANTGRGLLRVYDPAGGYLMPAPDQETLPFKDRELYAHIPAAATLPLNLPPSCRTHEVRVPLQRARTLQGRVLDAAGRPIPAGTVITAGPFAHYLGTDARRFEVRDGVFAVPNIHPGVTYPILVMDASREHGIFTTLGGHRMGEPAPLRLKQCGTAVGRLVGQSNELLPDATFELAAVLTYVKPGKRPVEVETRWCQALGLEARNYTDSSGRFTLSPLVQNVRYRLYASTNGARQLVKEFTATPSQDLGDLQGPASEGR